MEIQPSISFMSPPDRKELVAEILIANVQIAEVRRDHNNYRVQIFPRPDGDCWDLEVETLLSMVTNAYDKLRARLDDNKDQIV